MSGFETPIAAPTKRNEIKMLCGSKAFGTRCFKGQGNARGNTLLSDQRGAVAFETMIVYLFVGTGLLLPLADVAVAGLKYSSAYQALRDMGQRVQFSPPPDVTSIASWQSSLPSNVDGYSVSVQVYCGNPGVAPCASGATVPKYYTFTTSFTLSPMVLGRLGISLCSTCTVTYSQPFQ